jgi:hypothetical protein
VSEALDHAGVPACRRCGYPYLRTSRAHDVGARISLPPPRNGRGKRGAHLDIKADLNHSAGVFNLRRVPRAVSRWRAYQRPGRLNMRSQHGTTSARSSPPPPPPPPEAATRYPGDGIAEPPAPAIGAPVTFSSGPFAQQTLRTELRVLQEALFCRK